MFSKLLIANRGEIACRIIRTARTMGIQTVAIYSDADHDALHVQLADEAIHIGPAPASQSYIVIENILNAIEVSGAEAVHPGYGFLSENSQFAQALADKDVIFIGPPIKAIEAMGDKLASKKIAMDSGVNTIPGYMGEVANSDEALKIAQDIGYPVMIKASAGGGGKGMRVATSDAEVDEGFHSSQSEALSAFGDNRILIEKYVTSPRHIEIQILADQYGNCLYLNERECSIQRRNQKVIEEAPSSFLDQVTRQAMGLQAVALAQAVDYYSAGTVEFIVDENKQFYFLEMNTRLQVEHPVTELITGIDLVEKMIQVASGQRLDISQNDVGINGWSIESRIYAEDPFRNFLPSTGRLTRYKPPAEFTGSQSKIRNDTGVYEGGNISVHYDPMISKLCTWASDRKSAIKTMRKALDVFVVEGIASNLPFLSAVMDHPKFISGDISTAFIDQEYEDGFTGVKLSIDIQVQIAAAAVFMNGVVVDRSFQITGKMSNLTISRNCEWVVSIDNREFEVHYDSYLDKHQVKITGYDNFKIVSDWKPGQRIAEISVDSKIILIKVFPVTGGFQIQYRGSEFTALVRTYRQAELAKFMPLKIAPDMSRKLLCPMPGLLVSLSVEEGDEVVPGQALCIVEAMKMENVLKAERKSRISKIYASQGSILSVDETIMEFE